MSDTEDRQPAVGARGANLLPPQRFSATLYGREAEVEQLDSVFLRAVDYHAPQLVTVVGTAGVGKTRLVGEWVTRLLGRYAAGTEGRPRVYRGRALPGAGSY